MMTGASYEKAFDDAVLELQRLLEKRALINNRILEMKNLVCALGPSIDADKRRQQLVDILKEVNTFAPRLTDAVKDALYSAFNEKGFRQLRATEVRDLMEVRRFDFGNFPNPLASVHSTLRRLFNQGEIGSAVKSGITLYFWNGPHYGARKTLANMLATDAEQSRLMDRKSRQSIETWLRKFDIVVKH
jgi:hypothetical protein